MLILSRCLGESLMIGDDVVMTILDINDEQVCIGTAAPPTISIDREEIRLRKRGKGLVMTRWRPDYADS